MKELASRPQQLKRSGIREILELAVRTPGCIRLEIGEPNFPTPPHIVEAAARAARDGHTKYTLTTGILPLREAIINKLQTFNGYSNLDVDNVAVSPGSTAMLSVTFQTLVNQGDEVLVPDPGWPVYASQVVLAGGIPVFYPQYAADAFVPRLEVLEAAISTRTKAIVVCNPSNPTGAVYPVEIVRGIVELAQKYDLYIISDEVYEQLIFEGSPSTLALYDPERVVGIYSFSKTYSMTGWRVGYAVARQPLIGLIAKTMEPALSCTGAPNQMAALAALNGPQDFIEEMRLSYQKRRDLVCDILQQKGLYQYRPHGAFYVMIDITSTGMDSYEFSKELLRDRKVSTAPGGTFGPDSGNFVRVSLATAEIDLVEGINRICNFIETRQLVSNNRLP